MPGPSPRQSMVDVGRTPQGGGGEERNMPEKGYCAKSIFYEKIMKQHVVTPINKKVTMNL